MRGADTPRRISNQEEFPINLEINRFRDMGTGLGGVTGRAYFGELSSDIWTAERVAPAS